MEVKRSRPVSPTGSDHANGTRNKPNNIKDLEMSQYDEISK